MTPDSMPGNVSAKLNPTIHSGLTPSGVPDPRNHSLAHVDPLKQRIWDHVSHTPLNNLWDFQGVSPKAVVLRTFHSFMDDNLVSRAAELGYYFLFALFPTLITASAILGLVVQNSTLYIKLLNYLSLVVPQDAFKLVMETFNQTTTHSSGAKLIFGLAAGLWAASVGFSAIQDTLNIVYKVRETRPYWKVKGAAILVTVVLSTIVLLILGAMFAGAFGAHWLHIHIAQQHVFFANQLAFAVEAVVRFIAWAIAALLCVLLFAVIYYFAPDIQNKRWRWFTPGAAVGIGGWVLASISLRIYLHYFNSYSVTYGSLGAVIILLTWFYITGLMLLIGAELNSEIEAAAAECRLKAQGIIPPHATTDAATPIQAA
jgi:membrane protein